MGAQRRELKAPSAPTKITVLEALVLRAFIERNGDIALALAHRYRPRDISRAQRSLVQKGLARPSETRYLVATPVGRRFDKTQRLCVVGSRIVTGYDPKAGA